MKRNFKKFGLLLVLGLATAVIYSCGDDDDNSGGGTGGGEGGGTGGGSVSSITATNVNGGSSQIATVKAIVGEEVIAQAQYRNNAFTLNLPATMAANTYI